jgi:TolB protein
MNKIIPLALAFVAFSATAFSGDRRIAFERGGDVWVANLDGGAAKKIAAGAWPNISPDGTRIAFNTEQHPTRPSLERHIATVDVASGKVTIFKDIPSDNCFSPVWSHDGHQIAFYIMSEDDWHIGVVKSDGSDFRFLKKAGPNKGSFWSMCWAPDDRSYFCQDLTHLYHFALDGSLIKQWDVGKLTGGCSMSSGGRLDVSPSGRRMILDVDLNEESTRRNWDFPPPGIFVLDLENDSAKRVTAKGAYAAEPVWLNNDEFLCVIESENENDPSLYRVSIDGKNPKRLVKRVQTPSVSAP